MHTNWKRNITLFLTGQTISLFGTALVQYAIMWHITLTTQSGLMMTISIICGFVPNFLLSPFAGVWADRFNRKRLIIFADSFIAIATLILALLFLWGYNALWLLFAISAIRSFGTAVQTPAVGAILPQLVPEEHLLKVNGYNGSIQSLIMLVAPMASAALLTMSTIEIIFFIDVITAAIAIAILLMFVKVSAHAKAADEQTTSYLDDIRQGFSYINKHSFLKPYFIFCAIFFFLAAPAAFLTPLQVTRTFGDDVWRLTAIEIMFSIGMMLGGIAIASWGGFRNKIHTMTLSALMFAVGTFALGVIPNFWIYLGFMGFVGVAMPFFNTPSMTLLQEKVDPNYLGRVFGILGMLSSSMMPFGMLIFGPLADYMAIEWMLIGTGILLFIQAFFLFGSKVLTEAGEPVARAEQP